MQQESWKRPIFRTLVAAQQTNGETLVDGLQHKLRPAELDSRQWRITVCRAGDDKALVLCPRVPREELRNTMADLPRRDESPPRICEAFVTVDAGSSQRSIVLEAKAKGVILNQLSDTRRHFE